jgi:uncharacterized membrane protein
MDPEPPPPIETSGRVVARWTIAGFYLLAGILHLSLTDTFLLIVPAWVPFPRAVVLGTGVCEVAGAIGIMTRSWRRAASIGLALYAVCVFPANVKHALDGLLADQVQLGWWYHIPRLALQPVIVWWALWAGQVVDWPFARRRRS